MVHRHSINANLACLRPGRWSSNRPGTHGLNQGWDGAGRTRHTPQQQGDRDRFTLSSNYTWHPDPSRSSLNEMLFSPLSVGLWHWQSNKTWWSVWCRESRETFSFVTTNSREAFRNQNSKWNSLNSETDQEGLWRLPYYLTPAGNQSPQCQTSLLTAGIVFQQQFTQILIRHFRTVTPKADTDLLRQLQLGAVGALLRLQPHQVGNRSIQKMQERGRKDGDVHMLPLKREQQRCDSLCHRHQTLII